MKRRTFTKAGITALFGFPLGMIYNRASHLKGDALDQETVEEQDITIAQKLMERYEIRDLETAQKLYQRILLEQSLYFSGGAFIGSAFRSTHNEIHPESRRHFFHRAVNVVGGGGFAALNAYSAKAITQAVKKSHLTKPETLENEYGMWEGHARVFCMEYKNALTNHAKVSAAGVAILQEILSPIPESEAKNPRNHNDFVA